MKLNKDMVNFPVEKLPTDTLRGIMRAIRLELHKRNTETSIDLPVPGDWDYADDRWETDAGDLLWLPIQEGEVDQRIIAFEERSGGKNWLATVSINQRKPGGLGREFWNSGSGTMREVPETLLPGAFVEVASDRKTRNGNDRVRAYFLVLCVSETMLCMIETAKPGPQTKTFAETVDIVKQSDFFEG